MVYEDILCMEKVINIVLEKLTGMWQVAESNIGKYLLIKASWTAQLQIASDLANLTVGWWSCVAGHSWKKLIIYNTWCNKQKWVIFVLAMQEVSASDGPNHLDLIMNEIIGHISFFNKKYIYDKSCSLVKSVACCNTPSPPTPNWINSSSNTGTKFYRKRDPLQNLLYQINKKTCQTFMNNFVTLEASLKLWDSLSFHDNKKVVSLNRGSYGESGSLRLIRTVCKLVQDWGCESHMQWLLLQLH